MKEYKLSSDEQKYLMSVIINTKNQFIRKQEKRDSIIKFESIEEHNNLSNDTSFENIENRFFINELLRISKPYLSIKEFHILSKTMQNIDDFKEFKSYLRKNQRYDYIILSQVLKKIGGIFNE